MSDKKKKIHLLHESDEWAEPLILALNRLGVPNTEWHMGDCTVDMSVLPLDNIFYNRMSASAHTRGHRFAPELTSGLLSWLEANKRIVINGSNAMRLELSKMVQYSALKTVGISTPATLAVTSQGGIIEAFEVLKSPVITKHNRSGKGIGVRLFENKGDLEEYVYGADFEMPIDGITLVQNYIEAPDNRITRVEFIGKKFLYAVQVDTSSGFELCPADLCSIDEPGYSEEIDSDRRTSWQPKFQIIDQFLELPVAKYLVPRMEKVMQSIGIDIAAFEFIVDSKGNSYVYDINVNTNYSVDAEKRAGISGIDHLAKFLFQKLNAC